MDLALSGKVALVGGAGSGLGAAIAMALATEGARVALAGRTAEKLEATAQAIGEAGSEALVVPWDFADLSAIERSVGTIESKLGPVDILVNNTGGPPPTPAAGQAVELWDAQFRAMVLSVIALTDRVLPGMRERGWGRVITSTTSGVIAPIPGLGISNALRSSLHGWSKTLAREVGRDGVTVNVVVPGRIATERLERIDRLNASREGRDLADVAADSQAQTALGRYGEPSEYGDVVAFLASPRASYVTGSVIRVDGGLIPSV